MEVPDRLSRPMREKAEWKRREEKRLAETPPCGELLIGSVFVWEREFA